MPQEDLQLSFGGLTVGYLTPYRIKTITGLEDFAVRSQDDTTASRWGAIPGSDQADSSTIVVEFIFPNDPTTIAVLSAGFIPAEQSSGAALTWLQWKWPGQATRQRLVRCRKRSRPMTVASERTNGPVSMFVELHAPDPRAYSESATTYVAPAFGGDAVGLDLATGSGTGLGVDLSVGSGTGLGVDLTGVTGGGTVWIVNDGTVSSFAEVTFSAPAGMTRWRLSCLTTGDVATFEFPVSGPQQLTADFAVVATPKTGDAISLDGAARYPAWLHPRIPLAVVPGSSEWRFDVLDGDSTDAQAAIAAFSAWL